MNPIFDECFEFSITLEQCLLEGAMIAFTVMDHDVITANDFAGEAFMSLAHIPGVADCSSNVDNFHGLKQVDLPLMQQYDRREFLELYYYIQIFIPRFVLQNIRFFRYWNPERWTSRRSTS